MSAPIDLEGTDHETGREILRLFEVEISHETDPDRPPDVFHEHGQWWARVETNGIERTYSVVSCEPGIDGSGIDFELLEEIDHAS